MTITLSDDCRARSTWRQPSPYSSLRAQPRLPGGGASDTASGVPAAWPRACYCGGATGNVLVSYAAITPFVPGAQLRAFDQRAAVSIRTGRDGCAANAAPMAKIAAAMTITFRRFMTLPFTRRDGGFAPGSSFERHLRRVRPRIIRQATFGGFSPGSSVSATYGGFTPGSSRQSDLIGGFDPGIIRSAHLWRVRAGSSVSATFGGFDPGSSISARFGGFEPGSSASAKAALDTAQAGEQSD